jgi:hypothetical protein
MVAQIIEFPTDADPEPFRPAAAVRRHLANVKCSAILRARIPQELKRYLQKQAFASDQTLSRHVCRLILDAVIKQREQGGSCLQTAGVNRKSEEHEQRTA